MQSLAYPTEPEDVKELPVRQDSVGYCIGKEEFCDTTGAVISKDWDYSVANEGSQPSGSTEEVHSRATLRRSLFHVSADGTAVIFFDLLP